jgi:hypothetical protein
MSECIFEEAKKFVEKARKTEENHLGRTATNEEIELLKERFGDKIPSWYYHLISELPLIHMEIGWQAYESDDDYDGIEYVEIHEPKHMIEESFEYYPGIPISAKGYVCIGGDPAGSGDPYFVNFDTDNPPVYQIYHDSGDEADEILKNGKVKVANSLTELFKNGIVSA